MAWIYISSTGVTCRPDGSQLTVGFSGNGSGLNNPGFQGVRDEGPIPCGPSNTDGEYAIGELQPNISGPRTHLGPNIAQLIPSAAQQAFIKELDRDPESFFLHGGIIGQPPCVEPGMPLPTASKGCVVLQHDPRMEVLNSPDRQLLVRSGLGEIS